MHCEHNLGQKYKWFSIGQRPGQEIKSDSSTNNEKIHLENNYLKHSHSVKGGIWKIIMLRKISI